MKIPLGLVLALVCSLNLRAGENIVANPSFEKVAGGGLPDSWELFMPGPSSAAPHRATPSLLSVDTTVFKEGSRSIKISSPLPVRMSLHQENMPMIAGQKLHVKVWMKGENLDEGDDKGGRVRVGFSNKKSASLQKTAYAASLFLKSPAATFDWTLVEGDVVVPPEAAEMSFDCFLWNSKGTVWFDAPSVEVIGGPANPPGAVSDLADLGRYREADANLGEPVKDHPRVVFMGDSITQKWSLSNSFPHEPDYINRGISGQITLQMLSRFQQDVLALQPKVVWLLGGTNDLAGGYPPEFIVGNIKAMVELCKKNHIRIIVTSILPVTQDQQRRRPTEKIVELNKDIAALCQEEGVLYLDLYSKLANASGELPTELTKDGLHPNAQGYAAIAPAVGNAIHAEMDKAVY